MAAPNGDNALSVVAMSCVASNFANPPIPPDPPDPPDPPPVSVGSPAVLTPASPLDNEKDIPTKVPGRQGMKNTGGKGNKFRVLYCTNMDFSMNFEEMQLLAKQYGIVERIRLRLTDNETSLNGSIVFKDSAAAADAHNHLNMAVVNDFVMRTTLWDITNLKDDLFDFYPENYTLPPVERKAPIPVWFVATFKEGRSNYCTGSEYIHQTFNGITRNNMKKYGNGILIKAKNPVQAKLLQGYRPPQHSNIGNISHIGLSICSEE